MSMKEFLKHILGFFHCLQNGITYRRGVYVGRHVHFTNAKNIILGKGVQIRPDVDIFAGEMLVIGDRCDIGTRNRIVGNVIIEPDVLFGPDNFICSSNHVYENPEIPIKEQGACSVRRNGHAELKIGSGSWIGTHVAIIGDVHIGKNCVIGANAVVTRDVPDYCIVAGASAQIIKQYAFATKTWVRCDC